MNRLPYRVRSLDANLPDSKFSMVVLPDPEGPTIAVKVLGENFPLHSFSIFFTPLTLRIAPS